MLSIGNDIVDLDFTDAARTTQARFYLKILAPTELKLYEPFGATLLFEHFVWLSWTVKEATYKYSKRLHPQLLFSPPRTVIQQLSLRERLTDQQVYTGICSNGVCTVSFRSTLTSNYIYSIVSAQPQLEKLNSEVFLVDCTKASAQTHARVTQHAAVLSPNAEVKIVKNSSNIPTLVLNQEEHAVSISHHGRYGAFCY